MGIERFRAAERVLWERAGVEPVERRLTLPTGDVRVLEAGEGPPVLFVHGATNGGTSWVDLVAKLPDFRCIALDRPGCGLSDPIKTGPITDMDGIERYADDLIANVVDALGLDSVHVVATSYGGYFAIRGAAAHPDRVDSIVFYSWLIGAPVEKVAFSLRMAGVPGMKTLMAKMPTPRPMVKTMLKQIGLERAIDTGTFDEPMIDWFVSVLNDTDTMANDMRSSPDVVTPIAGLNTRLLHTDETLAKVTMPTLFLWGEEDTNGGIAVAKEFTPRLPNAELVVIERAGHAPWVDELDLCAAKTAAFLTAHA